MVAPLQGTLGVYQDVGNVLDVTYFVRPTPNLEQWVVGCRIS